MTSLIILQYYNTEKKSPAEFTIADLEITPTPTELNKQTTISFRIKNIGDENGFYNLILKIDGKIEHTEELFLSGKEEKEYTFKKEFTEAGFHTISVGNSTREIEAKIPNITYSNSEAPAVPDYDPNNYEEPPSVDSNFPPGYAFSLEWARHRFYVKRGGVVDVTVKNRGENPIFVYKVGVSGEWMEDEHWHSKEVGFTVEPGKEQNLGLLSFGGPEQPGEYEVKFGISLLARDRRQEWYDFGTKWVDPNSYAFKELEDDIQMEYIQAEYFYFNKIDGLVDPDSKLISEKASEITESYGEGYNIYKICALFDWVRKEIDYIEDEPGEDYWSQAEETLNIKGGDCEDHSILLASMIEAIDGEVRIILTENHAFTSIYIGDKNRTEEIMKAIDVYYGTTLSYTYWNKDDQNWLVLESTGGLYPGDLAVGAEFTETDWSFTKSQKIRFIEIL